MDIQHKGTEVINDLILINNDRMEGYTKALENLRDESDNDLRSLFQHYVQQARQFNAELKPIVAIQGEEPSSGTKMSGKLYRLWLDVKATFTGHDRRSILAECERSEDASKKAYEDALNEVVDFPSDVANIIRSQAAQQKDAHNRIRDMRDSAL